MSACAPSGDKRLFLLLRVDVVVLCTLFSPTLPPSATVSSISVPADPTSTSACGEGVVVLDRVDRVCVSGGVRFTIRKRGEIFAAVATEGAAEEMVCDSCTCEDDCDRGDRRAVVPVSN